MGRAHARSMLARTSALAGISLAALAAGAMGGRSLVRRYRSELRAAEARLAAVDRRLVSTTFADVECAELGTGEPLLYIHGIFGSCEEALRFRDQFPGRRLIAPSRFGYLGSGLPPH